MSTVEPDQVKTCVGIKPAKNNLHLSLSQINLFLFLVLLDS